MISFRMEGMLQIASFPSLDPQFAVGSSALDLIRFLAPISPTSPTSHRAAKISERQGVDDSCKVSVREVISIGLALSWFFNSQPEAGPI
jgi:hypothetical protein